VVVGKPEVNILTRIIAPLSVTLKVHARSLMAEAEGADELFASGAQGESIGDFIQWESVRDLIG
jgi:hypothetical protein